MGNMAKNLKKILIVIGVLLLALALRVGYIQIVGGEELSEATRAQSLISLEGSNTRGIIYDRNGAALVADQAHYVYIIKEEDFDYQTAKLLKETGASQVSSDNKGYYVYSSPRYDKAAGKKLIETYHAYILQASARYGDEQPAAHLIGYVNKQDASGAAGLELMYDAQLSGLDRKIYAAADVKGNILPGRELIITSDDEADSYVKNGIRTTVDKELQIAAENSIRYMDKDCAVIILDTKSGGVAAMACTPGFDPNQVDAYMENGSDELINKATQGEYAPGSIFKIIVAAAALEQGIPVEQKYVCSGAVNLEELSIGCKTGGEAGHGAIAMKEAMAQSCNSYFIQLGEEIGADSIIQMAEAFGLGAEVLDRYPQESAGHLMTEEERYGDAIGNLSIGQGELLITPLQAAAMTSIIANQGVDKGVHLLMEDEEKEEFVISQNSAAAISEMMQLTAKEGTGRSLQLTEQDGTPKAAVKTGTAEYGEKKQNQSHAWITGFVPCRKPEYTITVFVEGGDSGASSAGPVFQRILEYLEESGSFSMPTLA